MTNPRLSWMPPSPACGPTLVAMVALAGNYPVKAHLDAVIVQRVCLTQVFAPGPTVPLPL